MILGEGVRLRAPERSDLPRFVEWLNDPEVREGLLLFKPISLVGEEKWFEDMLQRPPEEHPLVIEVSRETEWIAVGNCGVHRIDWRSRAAELGIFIGEKSYWNQGIGTRVMGLLLKFGFETLNLNRIFLEVFEDNKRAIRAYEKAGFVHEGRKRQAIYKGGRYKDILLMSVLRSEWDH
ncbi:MAG: GNAT family protein [Anaerolineales bacterium]|jgi:diamine N-acetyltransferase